MVKLGFWLWKMSDFSRLPSQEEIMVYDPRWVSDMKLMMSMYSHKKNDSVIMNLYEHYMSYNENPNAYRHSQALYGNMKDKEGKRG